MIPDREFTSQAILEQTLRFVVPMDSDTQQTMYRQLSIPDHTAFLRSGPKPEPVQSAYRFVLDAHERLLAELLTPQPNPVVVYGLHYGLQQAATFFITVCEEQEEDSP